MPENTIFCQRCDSNKVVKNGFIHNGNQNNKCEQYGRQFVLKPKNKQITQETKDLIDKLLLEKLPLSGIARVTGVSKAMAAKLRQQLVRICAKRSRSLVKKTGRLTIQCDEMWSFVGNKKNKHWMSVSAGYRNTRNCWYSCR